MVRGVWVRFTVATESNLEGTFRFMSLRNTFCRRTPLHGTRAIMRSMARCGSFLHLTTSCARCPVTTQPPKEPDNPRTLMLESAPVQLPHRFQSVNGGGRRAVVRHLNCASETEEDQHCHPCCHFPGYPLPPPSVSVV